MPVINPSLVDVRDEGTSQGRVTALNFTGSGVTASVASGVGTINIPGGGAGASWTTVEVNLGSTPSWRGKVAVTDAAVSPTSQIIVQQAPGPYTGKGTRADEAEMDPLWCIAVPGSGTFDIIWRTMAGICHTLPLRGNPVVTGARPELSVQGALALQEHVVGLVRGNVKFVYTVA